MLVKPEFNLNQQQQLFLSHALIPSAEIISVTVCYSDSQLSSVVSPLSSCSHTYPLPQTHKAKLEADKLALLTTKIISRMLLDYVAGLSTPIFTIL